MAYKFQLGAAILSGSIQAEDGIVSTDVDATTADNVVAALQAGDIPSEKLAIANAKILIGDTDGDAQEFSLSGDVAMIVGGVVTISDGVVENDMLAGSIVASKMNNAIFEDLESLGAPTADGEFIVASNAGEFVYESGNTARTSLGLGTGNDVTFATGSFTGDLTVSGDLQVNGSLVSLDVTNLRISDKLIEVASGSANDTALDGGGIQFNSGDSNKSLIFQNTGKNLSSSENFNVASGKVFKVNNTEVLSATALGSSVVGSSLTSVGTIATGVWNGTAIATAYIADDAVTPAKMSIFDDALAATDTHIMIADGTDYSSFAVSGDATLSNAGVLTIANDAVEFGMLNDNVISSQTELLVQDIADEDELLISDGGTLKKVGIDSLRSSILAGSTPTSFGNANATLVVGVNFSNAAPSEDRTLTLPDSPGEGQSVRVKANADMAGGNYIIARDGSTTHTIDGATLITLESPNAAVELVYVGNDLWKVF